MACLYISNSSISSYVTNIKLSRYVEFVLWRKVVWMYSRFRAVLGMSSNPTSFPFIVYASHLADFKVRSSL